MNTIVGLLVIAVASGIMILFAHLPPRITSRIMWVIIVGVVVFFVAPLLGDEAMQIIKG